ncbi:MAG: tryptophan synthase subunit alpha [Gammaproteobacteria bacterium]|jgi:tryptophan synthase alpha chain|nr:tryptophan synthase subunit alpha [Gammaproteobacteria bacterium]MCH1530662.1 tryptophan synthase subunit alpha [Gammaproteobacteria bacterium]MDB3990675.1 tryptophan synthase subunit alpha [Gammaproteobacteria bacterium]RZO95822.1 MAG: tryptophan synthase subunit alpha [Gammaproteobacteria bacterium]|tara:strand:+ start:982 stop:1743 length:762 start_codon:yes stop_codon:yes gene_type:complete
MTGSKYIEERIKAPKASGPALIPFITAGYPNAEDFKQTLFEISKKADVIEIGVPFSDPMADGVTIQRSSHMAIENGVTLKWIFNQLKEINLDTPIVLMSYLNPLYVFGMEELTKASLESGVDGFIVPDLPIEESKELNDRLSEAGLALIQLVTPATPKDRIEMITNQSSGFIYAVTIKGVTGGEDALSADVTDYLKQVQEIAKIPVCAGFGIREKSDVEMLANHVDGIIVGSAIVETIEQGNSPTEFLDQLKN